VEDFRVPFGEKRNLGIKLSPEFMKLKRHLPDLLHHEQQNGFDREALHRKLVPQQHA